jgi:hypothetical protein
MAMQRTNAIVKEVCIDDVLKEDADKGKWVDLEEDSLHDMFACLANLNEADADAACLDDRFNFDAYGADWYEGKFPGFDDLVYEILAREHKALNADPVTENPEDYQ